ncbi:hypothetical protein JOB18_012092 [Solea senegalensis]|uniref:Uncharacterized protein n=1 Tax=Solea senegalensis TaxID=28829 RepID=A0AAV6RXG2_SOLSE|nr:hypothetical protein JOB18_012092 [Solea senegalensis]
MTWQPPALFKHGISCAAPRAADVDAGSRLLCGGVCEHVVDKGQRSAGSGQSFVDPPVVLQLSSQRLIKHEGISHEETRCPKWRNYKCSTAEGAISQPNGTQDSHTEVCLARLSWKQRQKQKEFRLFWEVIIRTFGLAWISKIIRPTQEVSERNRLQVKVIKM